MSRIVRVESVRMPAWSIRALAWGLDVDSGDHVAFALPRSRGEWLFPELEIDGDAFLKVSELDVLFSSRRVRDPVP